MAETGKKPIATTAVGATNDPAPDIARREGELPDTPDESRNASVRVATEYPHGSFIVEGVPEITTSGTMLTKSQFKAAQEAAVASGVSLREVK